MTWKIRPENLETANNKRITEAASIFEMFL